MGQSLSPVLSMLKVDAPALGRHRLRMDVTSQRSEEQRAEQIRAIATSRDRTAFIALFEFYAPRIKSQAMRFGVPADAAEDVAQDALLAVWTRAAQFDPARGSASAWIFTIATHARIDRLRRETRGQNRLPGNAHVQPAPLPEPVEETTPESLLTLSDQADVLSGALFGLSVEQRHLVELSFYQDTPHAAIASRLGIPLGTVKSRVRVALKRLRTLVGDR